MVLHYKCPSCGSDMAFDGKTGMLSCGSCGRNDDIESFPKELISNEFKEDETNEYNCNNCGAVLVTDGDTVATKCSFCGAGVVLGDRVAGELAPSKVIPFRISKQDAMIAFRKWCKNGLLTPRGFMSADRVKSITGIYVPFWLYDVKSNVELNAHGTKIMTYTRGDYIYTKTKYYDIYRHVDINYIKVPADASEKMNDALMDQLEPYDYSQLKDFNTPYLAGYIAEKYNYNSEDLLPRIANRITRYADSYVNSTIVGYNTVSTGYKNVDIKDYDAYYTLLPVWMVSYDYENSEHTFAMNGQTGKIVGIPPISKGKVMSWLGGVSAGIFVTIKIVSLLAGGPLW